MAQCKGVQPPSPPKHALPAPQPPQLVTQLWLHLRPGARVHLHLALQHAQKHPCNLLTLSIRLFVGFNTMNRREAGHATAPLQGQLGRRHKPTRRLRPTRARRLQHEQANTW